MADENTLPEHVYKPHVRPFQPVLMQKDGKQFVALQDHMRLNQQTMVVPVQVLQVLRQCQGKESIDDLATKFGGQRDQIVELVTNLDRMGLLWGPTLEKLEKERWDQLATRGSFPPRASSTMGEDAAACRAKIEGWFAETEDPELEETPTGLVAPHLDYGRGWPNYAAAYYAVRPDSKVKPEKPDRVVILGTNHFGVGDGVVGTDLGFESPLGMLKTDTVVVDKLKAELGKGFTVDQLDHFGEHSIDLHTPWISYCFGDVPVVAALVPDPLRPMIENDGERVSVSEFTKALKKTLAEVGGRTFFVSSADLSHVGPQFGEPRPVDDQRSMDVETQDREMMAKFMSGDAEEFIGAMTWSKNPTRWCSVGNMAATLMLAEPKSVELIDYRQARDEKGVTMVSSAAMVLS